MHQHEGRGHVIQSIYSLAIYPQPIVVDYRSLTPPHCKYKRWFLLNSDWWCNVINHFVSKRHDWFMISFHVCALIWLKHRRVRGCDICWPSNSSGGGYVIKYSCNGFAYEKARGNFFGDSKLRDLFLGEGPGQATPTQSANNIGLNCFMRFP